MRAPDGSLIYLLESGAPGQSNYDIDFRLHAVASAGTGLQRIDHMAPHCRPSLASWVLFYRSLFDFEADDELLLPDPA